MTSYPTVEFRPRVILSTKEIDILVKKYRKYVQDEDAKYSSRKPVVDMLELMIEVYLRKNGIDDIKE